jgi:hypothetical protein
MKTRNIFFVLSILLILNACKKSAPASIPVQFTSTTYQNLGTFDSTGEPEFLTTPDVVSDSLLAFVRTELPDGQNAPIAHPELFNNSAIADISITQPSAVYLTFVLEGCGYANAVAFYTYPTGQSPTSAQDIQLITYVFANAGNHTPLHRGDKVKLGTFSAGTSLGFVLMQNAFDTTTKTLNNNAVHFCSNDVLNPEVDPKLKKHAVLINYAPENKLLIGFEDVNRTLPSCDNDFNDIVLYTTVKPN